MDAKPHDYHHTCNACTEGFDNRTGGVKIGDEKFCGPCLKAYKHFEFYKENAGLTLREINVMVEENAVSL